MSVSTTICELQCELAETAMKLVQAKKYGDYGKVKSLRLCLRDLRILHFLTNQNNLAETEECFDNCELNKKLEQYGVSRL